MKNFKNKKGFTLLELLVVIGIISILVTLGFTSYTTVQKKARDARRKGDLTTFQKAIEQCYDVNSYNYPIISGTGTTSISYTCPLATGGPSLAISDPSNKIYTVGSTTTSSYSVTIQLEDAIVTSFNITNQQ